MKDILRVASIMSCAHFMVAFNSQAAEFSYSKEYAATVKIWNESDHASRQLTILVGGDAAMHLFASLSGQEISRRGIIAKNSADKKTICFKDENTGVVDCQIDLLK